MIIGLINGKEMYDYWLKTDPPPAGHHPFWQLRKKKAALN
jgi:hypothetical protein